MGALLLLQSDILDILPHIFGVVGLSPVSAEALLMPVFSLALAVLNDSLSPDRRALHSALTSPFSQTFWLEIASSVHIDGLTLQSVESKLAAEAVKDGQTDQTDRGWPLSCWEHFYNYVPG